MKAYWMAIETALTAGQVAARRRKLQEMVRGKGVEVCTVRMGAGAGAGGKGGRGGLGMARLVSEAQGCPVVAIDDGQGQPDKAEWLANLTREATHFTPERRPVVIYVTRRVNAAGTAQAAGHPVVRYYIQRDEKGRWVKAVAEAVETVAAEARAVREGAEAGKREDTGEIVGAALCFREAVQELHQLMQLPYALVTGQPGVGKVHLIRAIWTRMHASGRMIVLPCGSFFKDYYVAGGRRRISGGREAVDQLRPYFKEAEGELLVLHQIDRLPTGLQEELVARLSSLPGDHEKAGRVLWVDSEGMAECDVKLIATSNLSAALLEQGGHLVPELAGKLLARHVRIPSLTERGGEDVLLVADDILSRIAARCGLPAAPRLAADVRKTLAKTHWPNNTSDLVRVLEHAVRRCKGKTITRADLPADIVAAAPPARESRLDEIVAQAQRAAIQNALDQAGGSVPEAARILGRNKHALWRLMGALGMTGSRKARR